VNANVLFLVGTLASWVGWALAFRAILLLVDRAALGRQALNAGMGAALLIAGTVVTRGIEQANPLQGPGLRIPIVWVAMHFTGWIALVAALIGVGKVLQAFQSLTPEEQSAKLRSTVGWFVVAAISFALFRSNPKNEVVFFRGGINLSPGTAAAVLLLAIAAVASMALAGRKAATRSLANSIAAQATLLVGCVVFGLPFAYLLVTSFKEDRDMSSPNGIVWVPRVQQTVPYFDPKNPLYEAEYRGQKVQGVVLEKRPDGTARVDISQPLSIRGTTFDAPFDSLKVIPRQAPLVTAVLTGDLARQVGAQEGSAIEGMVVEDMEDGRKRVEIRKPATLKGKTVVLEPTQTEPIRKVGLRWQNYTEAISFLPPEAQGGWAYLRNTLVIVFLSVLGTLLSSSLVAYAFSRMRFPGRNFLFAVLLSTMMLPAAVTLLPQFLIFRGLGWIDTLLPLWAPAFFGSAFNIFLLRQFFMSIPMELEDASKMDGCSYLRTFWSVMLPQIKPALAVIAIWTFMGAWNNFMGPLIYINSPENMPISYALQLFQGDRLGEPGLLMALTTLAILPVLALFFFAQKYFIEGVTLSGFGGR
jgi:multiple sugar transport system permease protein